jgi:hypothetical protein
MKGGFILFFLLLTVYASTLKDEIYEATTKGRVNSLEAFEKYIKDECFKAAEKGLTHKSIPVKSVEGDIHFLLDQWKKINEPDVKIKIDPFYYVMTVCWMDDKTCE